jgi:ABC-type lipoprotein release transport system permease subunit
VARWLIVRAEFRQRWRSWLVLIALVGLVGGLVLAFAAAGRRTASAFPRFERRYGFDSLVYSENNVSWVSLPEVQSVTQIESPPNGTPECSCSTRLTSSNFSVWDVARPSLDHFVKLMSGRWPDQTEPDQVLASFNLAHDYHVHLGSLIRVPFYTKAQTAKNDTGTPTGPAISFRVVGIDATESDFPSVGAPSYEVITTDAFARAVTPATGVFYASAVRLRHPSDLGRFDQDAARLAKNGGTGGQEAGPTVTAAIHPQAIGWWLLALLSALAGAVIIAQALSRQARAQDDTARTLRVFGLRPSDITVVGLIRTAVIAAAGAALAVAIAFLVSPLAPVGEARVAEVTTGFAFDVRTLVLGAGAITIGVLLLGVWPAVRVARQARIEHSRVSRTSRTASALATVPTPPAMTIGVRRAVEHSRGSSSAPTGTAIVGAIVAVIALCATAIFGASLTHLTSTPRLYGQPFQMWVQSYTQGTQAIQPALAKLKADPSVTAITEGVGGAAISINGVTTDSIAGTALRGDILVSSISGRIPTAPGEIALGGATMRAAHAHVGSTVRVTVGGAGTPNAQTSSFHVVGTASFPPDFGAVGLSRGAVFSLPGFIAASCPPGNAGASCRTTVTSEQSYVLLVGLKPDADGRAAVARYATEFGSNVLLPVTPSNIVNFGEAVNFPLIVAIVIALFGIATLVHVLSISVGRRRHELSILKALGFTRRQAAASVWWQAATVAAIGVVVGIPIGVAVGRRIWSAFATNLGVISVPSAPVGAIAALAIGVLLTSLLLALGPAVIAARTSPSPPLRDE